MPVGGKAAGGVPGERKAGRGLKCSNPARWLLRPRFRSARNRGQDGIASAGGRVFQVPGRDGGRLSSVRAGNCSPWPWLLMKVTCDASICIAASGWARRRSTTRS